MTQRFTISTLSTIDPVVRTSVSLGLALERSDVVVIHHDFVDDRIHRVVADAHGIIETSATELDHACLGCAVREDLVPTLARLMGHDRWRHALVALPVTAESAPVMRALHSESRRSGMIAGARLGAVVCAVDSSTIADDAFSDDFLADIGRPLLGDDDRVLAEAVAPMLAHADIVALVGDEPVTAQARATVDHLRGKGSTVLSSAMEDLDAALIMGTEHRCDAALGRVDPLRLDRHVEPDCAGVWSIDLRSDRPFHPDRLRARLTELGGHEARTRGHFWVPTRPTDACAWDGAGRQVSVGSLGSWGRHDRATRLVATGRGPERDTIAAAFHDCLVRDDERGTDWHAHGDALDDWLGAHDSF
ncbi:CobW family GTP-binding protein [Demequina muriae]|uniref:GTP-binding protein n=1 Tax=Demequina muriae TaxID=3051664 RepID=A0ABT8GJ40_9MICO|nr:GTP-binding protein [Demequina sp. EGI L300058]MDN4481448.1 GTP-binding protein [Demequina sp. EGI L300058]